MEDVNRAGRERAQSGEAEPKVSGAGEKTDRGGVEGLGNAQEEKRGGGRGEGRERLIHFTSPLFILDK